MERTPETKVVNEGTGASKKLSTIADWETNHFPAATGGAGFGAGSGAGSGGGASSASATGSLGIGSGATTNVGGGVVTPLPSLTTPSSMSNSFTPSSPTFGLPATNIFGQPR